VDSKRLREPRCRAFAPRENHGLRIPRGDANCSVISSTSKPDAAIISWMPRVYKYRPQHAQFQASLAIASPARRLGASILLCHSDQTTGTTEYKCLRHIRQQFIAQLICASIFRLLSYNIHTTVRRATASHSLTARNLGMLHSACASRLELNEELSRKFEISGRPRYTLSSCLRSTIHGALSSKSRRLPLSCSIPPATPMLRTASLSYALLDPVHNQLLELA